MADVAAAVAARVEAVVAELPGVDRRPVADGVELVLGDRLFAVLAPGAVEVLLDAAVAGAAVRTPDAQSSERGPGWVRFRPTSADPFALDRAEAWLRSAHRRASGA
ncbi:MAG TPA: hypothetical protein VH813_08615 [Candidatus Limnocylindrales bacterium]|jgi:hypothetical protein